MIKISKQVSTVVQMKTMNSYFTKITLTAMRSLDYRERAEARSPFGKYYVLGRKMLVLWSRMLALEMGLEYIYLGVVA